MLEYKPPADIQQLMRAAYGAALESTDRVTQNGAILVNLDTGLWARGYNHHIAGYGNLEKDHERPRKYSLTEHAERDVIFKATRAGFATEGCMMVANWVACPDCARAIILAGITKVFCHKQCMDLTPPRWDEMVNLGLEMLRNAEVEVVQWDGKVARIENLNNGEVWYP